jgi:hypothetical protein
MTAMFNRTVSGFLPSSGMLVVGVVLASTILAASPLRHAASARLSTDLDTRIAETIGHGAFDAGETLRRGLTFSWSGAAAIDAAVVVAVLRDGRVAETRVSTLIRLRPGQNRLPAGAALPETSIDRFVEGDRFVTAGVVLESDLNTRLREIAESGVVVSGSRVDWARQEVLVLAGISPAAVPALDAGSKVVGATLETGTVYVRPIAFIVRRR